MKVLLLSGGVGTVLGQTMRTLAIARRLARKGEEVVCGYTGHPNEVVDTAGVPVTYLPEPPGRSPGPNLLRSFAGALDSARLAAARSAMDALRCALAVEEEALARRFHPDVIVAGSISGPSVARAIGVPCAVVAPQFRRVATLSRFLEVLRSTVQGWMGSVDTVIVEGMPELAQEEVPLPWGDAVPIVQVGPILLQQPDELPSPTELRRRFGVGDEPLVWVTVGGGSELLGESFLAMIAEAFRALPDDQALISTGFHVQQPLRKLPPNVRAERFFPGEEAVWASDAVVFHGGSSTLMSLVGLGRPGVAVPAIDEQRDNAAVLERFGAGLSLDPRGLTPALLAQSVGRVLAKPSFRQGSERLRDLARSYGGAGRAAEIVLGLVGRR